MIIGTLNDDISKIDSEKWDEQALKLFLYWIIERYRIFIKKQIQKKPFPWTEDVILQKYSFTNVRRIQDRVTKFVLDEIINNDELTIQQKLLNVAWFRIFNEPNTFKLFKFPIRISQLQTDDFKKIHDKYEKMIPQKIKLSRGAYMNSGTMRVLFDDVKGYRTTLMPWHIIWKLYHSEKFKNLLNSIKNNDAIQGYNIINSVRGLGEFLSYQIYIDMTYIKEVPFSQDDIVIMGPGARVGAVIINPYLKKVESHLFAIYLRKHIDELFEKYFFTNCQIFMRYLPKNERFISLSNIQNCLCQFSKYYKFLNSQKRVKTRLYNQQ